MWIRDGRRGGVKEIDLTDFEVKLIGFVMDWRSVYKGPCASCGQMSLKYLSDMQMRVSKLPGYGILTHKK